jgi:hypothetical protein
MRTCSPIKGEWLVEIAPHYYQSADVEEPNAKRMPNMKGAGKATME